MQAITILALWFFACFNYHSHALVIMLCLDALALHYCNYSISLCLFGFQPLCFDRGTQCYVVT